MIDFIILIVHLTDSCLDCVCYICYITVQIILFCHSIVFLLVTIYLHITVKNIVVCFGEQTELLSICILWPEHGCFVILLFSYLLTICLHIAVKTIVVYFGEWTGLFSICML